MTFRSIKSRIQNLIPFTFNQTNFKECLSLITITSKTVLFTNEAHLRLNDFNISHQLLGKPAGHNMLPSGLFALLCTPPRNIFYAKRLIFFMYNELQISSTAINRIH